jgi:uncharacterized protein DUF4239
MTTGLVGSSLRFHGDGEGCSSVEVSGNERGERRAAHGSLARATEWRGILLVRRYPRVPMSRTFWLRLIIAMPITIAVQVVLFNRLELQADVGSVGAFVTAVGTLYSVLTGFTVVSVWGQFTDTDRAIKREAREIAELWRYAGYVSDVEGAQRARNAIRRYRDEVVGTEWPTMVRGETATAAEDEFLEMTDAVNAIKVDSPKDVPAWSEAAKALGAVSDARGERTILVLQRMPVVLRILLYIATLSLVGGMTLLGFQDRVIGVIIVGFTVVVSLLVLEVIDDLDDPFTGAWAISSEPFERITFGSLEHQSTSAEDAVRLRP